MNYTIEAKYVKRSFYGSYCNMCRTLKIEIKPYYEFNMVIYNEIKNLYNNN